MERRAYCTYFDRNYLVRGVALINSLRAHDAPGVPIFVVAIDDESAGLMQRLALPNVTVIPFSGLEASDPQLRAAKNDRSRVEYLWTTTPTIILRILEQHPEIDLLTYTDADLCFFSSPQPIFDEMTAKSVLIHEHRFPPEIRDMEANGKYNVGLLCFRNGAAGKKVLQWWRERCLESCHYDLKSGKCGDQMYLNDWPSSFPGVHVLQNNGGGIAPWNVYAHSVTEVNGSPRIDGDPLIFYHFQSFKVLDENSYYKAYRYYIQPDADKWIYRPYFAAIKKAWSQVLAIEPDFRAGTTSLTLGDRLWALIFSTRVVSQFVFQIRLLKRISGI